MPKIRQTGDRPIDKFLARLKNVKKVKGGWTAQCPCHDDHHNSLSISEGVDSRVLLYCHAGCHFHNIVKALELEVSDMFTENTQLKNKHYLPKMWNGQMVVKTYEYTDEKGNLLYQVCRTLKKEFPIRRPDGKGGWIWGLDDTVPVLYRLPLVVQTVKQGELIFVVEGEKDVDRLCEIGLPATTNPLGAGKWRDSYSHHFKNANVVILPDNDEPGIKHAKNVAEKLYGIASSIKIVYLPGVSEKGDVSDWVDKGGTPENLHQLIDKTDYWLPLQSSSNQNEQDILPSESYHLTDYGNAERLVSIHGQNLRFCPTWKAWMFWDGMRWRQDTTGRLQRYAKQVVRSIYGEARKEEDDQKRQQIAKHALRSESHARIQGMLDLAWSEEGIPLEAYDLDTDPWLLNVKNGTLDLHTGQIFPHNRENLLTKLVPVAFDKNATCPLWLRFLHDIMGGNQEMIDFLQRAVGYTLTGAIREHSLFFLYGTGRNGKTTFLETIHALLGDYAEKAELSSFLVRKYDNNVRNDLAKLRGARLVSAAETKDGTTLDVSVVKQVTGGDTITARFLYGEFFSFHPAFKLWMAANHKPDIKDTTDAIWERVKLIPFLVKFEKPDLLLPEKLKDELPGILAWAVRGCLLWQQQGLNDPFTVKKATAGYKQEIDPLAEFFDDECILSSESEVPAKTLYDSYTAWCSENSEASLNKKAFGLVLLEKGMTPYRTSTARMWRGLRTKK